MRCSGDFGVSHCCLFISLIVCKIDYNKWHALGLRHRQHTSTCFSGLLVWACCINIHGFLLYQTLLFILIITDADETSNFKILFLDMLVVLGPSFFMAWKTIIISYPLFIPTCHWQAYHNAGMWASNTRHCFMQNHIILLPFDWLLSWRNA